MADTYPQVAYLLNLINEGILPIGNSNFTFNESTCGWDDLTTYTLSAGTKTVLLSLTCPGTSYFFNPQFYLQNGGSLYAQVSGTLTLNYVATSSIDNYMYL